MPLTARPVADGAWVFALSLLFVGGACQGLSQPAILSQASWAPLLGWDPSASSPCSWPGIGCHADGTVARVSLAASRLQGTLPEAWSQLTSLTQVALENNLLTGTLPPEWADLNQLQSLTLSQNQLSGQLPASWGQLGQLRVLKTSYNSLSGPLPGNYSRLSQLQILALDGNQLTGSLPAQWSQLENLTDLELNTNSLSSTLPESWSQLSQLQTLWLWNNQLTGTLPASWQRLQNLTDMNLSYNKLSSTLPESWSQLSQLQVLRLWGNQLTGPLPASWQHLQRLTDLELSSNMLNSTLPESWSQLSQLQTLLLWANQLTGPLPASWQQLQKLVDLELDNNLLNSTLPESWSHLGQLQVLMLQDNLLTGPLPASWQQLQNLTDLELDNNRLSSTLPESWSQLTLLQTLKLMGNQLTGPLPDSWSQLTLLVAIGLGQNALVGTLPANWSQLGQAQYMGLNDNMLTGSLPPEWQQMQNIRSISLQHNMLNATLPQSWAHLGRLKVLNLSSNSLSGALPASYSQLTQLQYLDMGENHLTGQLPNSWLQLKQLRNISVGSNSLTGTLPQSWSAVSHLQEFNMSHNAFTGVLPTFGPGMYTLALQRNNLTGTLPEDWLAAAYNLTYVMLHSNRLSGTLPPAWLLQLTAPSTNISELDLAYNDLTGSLPTSVAPGGRPATSHVVGAAATVTLEPMNPGFGLCGPIPDGISVVSPQTGERLRGSLSAGSCPGGGSAAPASTGGNPSPAVPLLGSSASSSTSITNIIIPVILGGALVIVTSAMAFALWRLRRKLSRQPEPPVDMEKGHLQAASGFGMEPAPAPSSSSSCSSPSAPCSPPPSPTKVACAPAPDLEEPLAEERQAAPTEVHEVHAICAIVRGEVDVGPLLGRGTFGSVHKGRWHDMLVAIKMLEHAPGMDMLRQAERVEREALLATSLSHPNVVTTLEVCTMSGSTAHMLREASSGNTGRSAANPARTPQQPGSISNEDDGSGQRSDIDSAGPMHDNGLPGSGPGSPAKGMPRDPAMSEQHGGSLHVSQSPSGHAEEPEEVEHGISSSPFGGTGRSGGSSQEGAAAVGEEASFDSAADNAGRRPVMPLADERQDSLSPEELDAEDDAEEEARERRSHLLETWCMMDYAERGSLAGLLRGGGLRRAGGAPDLAAIVQCLQDIANGMDYLHGAGIPHGDLKPTNVLLKSATEDTRGFICKLSDFGLSHVLEVTEEALLVTQTHGTMPYLAPEVLEHSELTPAADTYSFGMIMWESFTGEVPFKGLSADQIYSGVVHERARPPLDAFSAAKKQSPQERPALEVYMELLQSCWSAWPSSRPGFTEVVVSLAAIRGLLPRAGAGQPKLARWPHQELQPGRSVPQPSPVQHSALTGPRQPAELLAA